MTLAHFLAVNPPYWVETLTKIGIGLVAVLLPTGALVYLFLFKKLNCSGQVHH